MELETACLCGHGSSWSKEFGVSEEKAGSSGDAESGGARCRAGKGFREWRSFRHDSNAELSSSVISGLSGALVDYGLPKGIDYSFQARYYSDLHDMCFYCAVCTEFQKLYVHLSRYRTHCQQLRMSAASAVVGNMTFSDSCSNQTRASTVDARRV